MSVIDPSTRKFFWCFFFRCGTERGEETYQRDYHQLVVFTSPLQIQRCGKHRSCHS